MKVRISNIQRFSLHDGPGIRTTIFLKGCNLNCPWCANPENIDFEPTPYNNENTKEKGVFGQDIEVEDLLKEILKDKEYYKMNNGGVTFSGGEPLLQIKSLEPLLKKLNKENIHTCIETALQVPTELVKIATDYIDKFIIDIKILNPQECRKVLNGNIEIYMQNLEILAQKHQDYIFRIPVVKEYTLKQDNVKRILELLKKYHCEKVEIFKIHNLAESKYRSIGKNMPMFSEIEDKELKKLLEKIKTLNISAELIEI